MQEQDSFKKRYAFKILTNLIGFPLGLISQSIIPRALGPVAYGNFTFLTDFFSQVVNFFDAGTSIGFYVKLSQRQKEQELLRFYWNFILLVTLLLVLAVIGVIVIGKQDLFWPGQQIKFIGMGVFFALLAWFSEISLKVVDAHGLTKKGEIARLLQRIIGFFLLLLMFYFQRFSLTEFFLYNYATVILLIAFWWKILGRSGIHLFPAIRLPFALLRKYIIEFYHYAAPLIVYSLVGLATGVLDRWFLQKFSGSVEQGFYGLSYQIGAVCFLFTMAMTPLITREFSIAYGEKDFEKMRYYFQRFIPMLYSIAAFLSVFIMLQADKVALIMGGESFKGSSMAIAIMALYPIHQTYGQLSGSVYYATGKTKLFRNIGIIMMLVSLPFTFLILAPSALHGLNLGSTGLAAKMVLFQFITVNVQLWFNCKFLQLPFLKFLLHQFYSVAILGGCAYAAAFIADLFSATTIISFVLSGIIYCFSISLLLIVMPGLFSTSRVELMNQLAAIKKTLVPL